MTGEGDLLGFLLDEVGGPGGFGGLVGEDAGFAPVRGDEFCDGEEVVDVEVEEVVVDEDFVGAFTDDDGVDDDVFEMVFEEEVVGDFGDVEVGEEAEFDGGEGGGLEEGFELLSEDVGVGGELSGEGAVGLDGVGGDGAVVGDAD